MILYLPKTGRHVEFATTNSTFKWGHGEKRETSNLRKKDTQDTLAKDRN